MIRQLLLNSKKEPHALFGEIQSFQEASHFGILFDPEDVDVDEVDDLIEKLKDEQKVISTMSYSKGKEGPAGSFSKKDISIFGNIQSKELNSFMSKRYDFLIVVAFEMDINLQFVIKSITANYKVGINPGENQALFQLVIESETDSLFVNLMKYLKMIRHD